MSANSTSVFEISGNAMTLRIWNDDYFLLKNLRSTIAQVVKKLPKNNGKIIDYGCGSMPYKSIFDDVTGDYIGCDILGSGASIEFEPDKRVPVADGVASCVVSFQVLEHVADANFYLSECHRMLSKDGLLILSTHGVWPYHPHPTDYRRWMRQGLELDISNAGFHIVDTHSLVGPGAWTLLFQVGALGKIVGKIPWIGGGIAAFIIAINNLILGLVDKFTPSELVKNNASVYLVLARKD